MKRIYSIDVMRGFVMIIMALDHVRDLMHTTSLTQSPTDLNTTTPGLFFTRWITHLCAPTFVFLSGVSAYLSMQQKNNIRASKKFLLQRGLGLIFLEFTLVNFGLWFDVHFDIFIFDVIATIGVGFIILSFLFAASPRLILIIGCLIICLHNLVSQHLGNTTATEKFISAFFLPGAFPFGKNGIFIMGYPPIPWLGIMLLGFSAAHFFELPISNRKKLFYKIGVIAITVFCVIRFINFYGDSFAFAKQKNNFYTFLSFINVTKYPPSLDFCLLFLGIMFLILAIVEGVKNKLTEIACVYGKVPLFYFVAHWYIIHPLMFAMVFLQGFKTSGLVFGSNFGRPKTGSGFNLWLVYVVWIAIVILFYPLCKWFWKYKQEHKEIKWLRFF